MCNFLPDKIKTEVNKFINDNYTVVDKTNISDISILVNRIIDSLDKISEASYNNDKKEIDDIYDSTEKIKSVIFNIINNIY